MSDQNNIDKIRSILLHKWDPFCVGENPNLADEYDSFIPRVLELLYDSPSVNSLNLFFANAEKELHAPVSDAIRTATVKALLEIM